MNNKDYILDKIVNSEVSNEPWKHLIIKDFLPNDFYNAIKEEISQYRSEPRLKQEKVRAFHIFYNKSVNCRPDPDTPNLLEYYNILLDQDIFTAMREKLPIFNFAKEETFRDFYSQLDFFTKGFNYGEIHTDRNDKLMTMIHYLAEEGDDELLGTFFYPADRNASDLDVYRDKVKIAPYIKNCVCIFSPYDTPKLKTNHCMTNKSDRTFLRNSFINIWLREEVDDTKDVPRGSKIGGTEIKLKRLKFLKNEDKRETKSNNYIK